MNWPQNVEPQQILQDGSVVNGVVYILVHPQTLSGLRKNTTNTEETVCLISIETPKEYES